MPKTYTFKRADGMAFNFEFGSQENEGFDPDPVLRVTVNPRDRAAELIDDFDPMPIIPVNGTFTMVGGWTIRSFIEKTQKDIFADNQKELLNVYTLITGEPLKSMQDVKDMRDDLPEIIAEASKKLASSPATLMGKMATVTTAGREKQGAGKVSDEAQESKVPKTERGGPTS